MAATSTASAHWQAAELLHWQYYFKLMLKLDSPADSMGHTINIFLRSSSYESLTIDLK